MKLYAVAAHLDLLNAIDNEAAADWVEGYQEAAVVLFPTKVEAIKAIENLEYFEGYEEAYLYTLDLSATDVAEIFNDVLISTAVGETPGLVFEPRLSRGQWFSPPSGGKLWPRETYRWVETEYDFEIKKVT